MAPTPMAVEVPVGQLDRIETMLAEMAAELAAVRRERDALRELTHDLMPVAQGAMTVASRELEDLSRDVSVEDLTRFLRTAVRVLPRLEALLAQVGPAGELVHEVTGLTGAGMGALSERLADAERRGYFAFARGAAVVADRVVTEFGEDDLRALGDNVVLILRTVQQMTQPEVMAFLARTADDLHDGADDAAPSAIGLARRLRDPEVRRGLARALAIVRDLGEIPSVRTRSTTSKRK